MAHLHALSDVLADLEADGFGHWLAGFIDYGRWENMEAFRRQLAATRVYRENEAEEPPPPLHVVHPQIEGWASGG